MNKQFHRNIVMNDDFGVCMAALNYSGMIIASKAQEQEEDEYEDDLEVDEQAKRKKNSNIMFKPFNEWKDAKDWSYELKGGESVECVAVGSGWCAALTDFNYIRIFSSDGIQRHLLCQGTPVVSMAGYESFLSIIYHSGPPIYGC